MPTLNIAACARKRTHHHTTTHLSARSIPALWAGSATAAGSGTAPVIGTTSCGDVPHVTAHTHAYTHAHANRTRQSMQAHQQNPQNPRKKRRSEACYAACKTRSMQHVSIARCKTQHAQRAKRSTMKPTCMAQSHRRTTQCGRLVGSARCGDRLVYPNGCAYRSAQCPPHRSTPRRRISLRRPTRANCTEWAGMAQHRCPPH